MTQDPPGQLVAVRRRLGPPAAVLRVRAGRSAPPARAGAASGTDDAGGVTADAESPDWWRRRPARDACSPSTAYLVYLFKRGTFYPFVPDGHEQRDTEQELKLKSLVADDLTVETDLDRWFPLWDLPVG